MANNQIVLPDEVLPTISVTATRIKSDSLIGMISSIKKEGLARNNRYRIELNKPASLANNDTFFNMEKIQMYCEQVNIPGLNVNTFGTRSYGETREAPYEFNYDPINLTFYSDTGMNIKYFFDSWIKSIQRGNSRTYNYYNDYTCPMKIIVQNIDDEEIYKVTLHEVFPKITMPILLDYGSKDVMKVSVTLEYKYWDVSFPDVIA